MKISEAYALSVQHLKFQTDTDQQDAQTKVRLLMDHITGIYYAHLMQPETDLEEEAQEKLRAGLNEIVVGRPLPYLLAEWEFFGLKFFCDERALIPRPETETLVEAALEQLRDKVNPAVADLGTGTGCIAISIAHSLPTAEVYATDVSKAALDLARSNAVRHHVQERVRFIAGSVGDWVRPLIEAVGANRFEVVLSNPPYIAAAEIEHLQPEIHDWEPRTALDGGEDGLDCYRQIAAQCDVIIKPDGFLMVELGAGQYDAVRAVFKKCGWWIENPVQDLAGIKRVLIAHR